MYGNECTSMQSVDINHYFMEAKNIFHKLYPNEIFMVKQENKLNDEIEEMDNNELSKNDNNIESQSTENIESINDNNNIKSESNITILPKVEDEDLEYLLATLNSLKE